MSQIKPLTEAEREKYINEFAAVLGVPPNAFEIAAFLIRENKSYKSACSFAFGLSKAYPQQVAYINKAAAWLKNYINGAEAEVTADWMYQVVVGYIEEVDPTYESISTVNN